MKKILTLPTVIVFLITILFAGGCSSPVPLEYKEVTIYLKAIKENGENHLEMYDSNDPTIVVVDTLVTDVMPGTKVIWTPVDDDSGIEILKKIGPEKPDKIITKDAEKISGTKKLKLKIPKKAPIPSKKEKYDIVIVDEDGNTWPPIDPYLEIPDEDEDEDEDGD